MIHTLFVTFVDMFYKVETYEGSFCAISAVGSVLL